MNKINQLRQCKSKAVTFLKVQENDVRKGRALPATAHFLNLGIMVFSMFCLQQVSIWLRELESRLFV